MTNPYDAQQHPQGGSHRAPQDPYAAPQDPYGAQPGGPQQPYGAQQPQPGAQHSYGAQQAQPGTQQPYGAPQAQPGAQQPQGAPAGAWSDVPPPGTPGVSAAPMTGQPVTDSEARMWAMLAQLSTLVLGFIGPLVAYLIYRDRNRFVRFHAAEALNLAIGTAIAMVAGSILLTIVAAVTLGFGSLLFPLLFLIPIYPLIVAIIGAVKANNGEWWPYPVNIRFLS